MSQRSRIDPAPSGLLDLDPRWIKAIQRSLLQWYANHARELPWRRRVTPYRVWVSEIMLQQTQVASVIPYFRRFIKEFPTIGALAASSEQDVLRLWEGLGYYRRARQLHQAAKLVVERHGGKLPTHIALLRQLPGIGRYTAGAILSIAKGLPEPILEANSRRVLARLLGFKGDAASSRGTKRLWEAATRLVPQEDPGGFNQALMELGSGLCNPKSPLCGQCPLQQNCQGHHLGIASKIPLVRRKARSLKVQETAIVITDGDQLLIRQRGPNERWAGLWDFPRLSMAKLKPDVIQDTAKRIAKQELGIPISRPRLMTTIQHTVTRYRITLYAIQAHISSRRGPGLTRKGAANAPHYCWAGAADLESLPLTTPARRLFQFWKNQSND